MLTCVECGAEIEGSRYNASRRMYCSMLCKKAAWRRAHPRHTYTPRQLAARRRLAGAARGTRTNRTFVGATCMECGTIYVVLGIPDTKVCSPLCRRRRRRRAQRISFGSLSNARRRARHFGVEYEPIKRTAVFDRDQWRCALCGKSIDPLLVVPHPEAATLDHVVPVSRGGGHLYGNVQAAHLMCNSIKGNGLAPEQLALIG